MPRGHALVHTHTHTPTKPSEENKVGGSRRPLLLLQLSGLREKERRREGGRNMCIKIPFCVVVNMQMGGASLPSSARREKEEERKIAGRERGAEVVGG